MGPEGGHEDITKEFKADETSDMSDDDYDDYWDASGSGSDDDLEDMYVADYDVLCEQRERLEHPEAILTEISSEENDGFEANEIPNVPATDFDREKHFPGEWVEGERPRQHLQFTATPGLIHGYRTADFRRKEKPEPIDYFELFIKREDYETIANETNKYHDQVVENMNLKEHSRLHKWVPTHWKEIKTFTAMTIAMGLVVQSNFNSYWSKSDVLSTPFFAKCMSRDRFWILMNFFHLSDNRLMPGRKSPSYSPINKLGSLYHMLVFRFQKIYIPHQQVSVDEGMVPWKGNLSFKVYQKDKPKKYGMKAYMLCDSTNGYVVKFKLYTGKYEVDSEGGKTYNLVMDFMKAYEHQGYHIFMDNFYASPELFVNLWGRYIGATGTLRVRRKGVPAELKSKTISGRKMEKGEMKVMNNQGIMLGVRYEDRKSVLLLSTVEDVQLEEVESRKKRWDGEVVRRPRLVNQYNKYMGGVDRADQLLSYSPFKVKTLKWWKRVWFHMVNVALTNSFILYRERTDDRVLKDGRTFRKDIVQSMVEKEYGATERRPRGRPSTSDNSVTRLSGRHFPTRIKPIGKKQNVTHVCVVCSQSRRHARKDLLAKKQPITKKMMSGRHTSYECMDCAVALCVVPCFKLYHTKRDFISAYLGLENPSLTPGSIDEDITGMEGLREDGEDEDVNVNVNDDSDSGW